MEKNWYQIYTKPNAEKKLYSKLQKCGFEAYLPVKKIKKQFPDRIKISIQPAMKSYLFAKLTKDEMNFVKQLSGFCFFVSFGYTYKEKHNKEICYPNITDKTIGLINLILSEYPEVILQESKKLKGDKVEFIEGSLKNVQGVLMHLSETKVAIKIPGLQQAMIMNVPGTLWKKIT